MSSSPQDIHHPITGHSAVQCLILRETAMAILVTCKENDKDEWFPLSQVSYVLNTPLTQVDFDSKSSEYPDIIHAADWILAKKGLSD